MFLVSQTLRLTMTEWIPCSAVTIHCLRCKRKIGGNGFKWIVICPQTCSLQFVDSKSKSSTSTRLCLSSHVLSCSLLSCPVFYLFSHALSSHVLSSYSLRVLSCPLQSSLVLSCPPSSRPTVDQRRQSDCNSSTATFTISTPDQWRIHFCAVQIVLQSQRWSSQHVDGGVKHGYCRVHGKMPSHLCFDCWVKMLDVLFAVWNSLTAR